MNTAAHANVIASIAIVLFRFPFCDASTASAIVSDDRIRTPVFVAPSPLLSTCANFLNSSGEPDRRMMYVPRIAMKNMISLARNIQMATLPGGVGSPCAIIGSGACSSGM